VGGAQLAMFIAWGFLVGIVAIWLYAGIRPRYGAGPKTDRIVRRLGGLVPRLSAGGSDTARAESFPDSSHGHWPGGGTG
jgi:hypothetical protein